MLDQKMLDTKILERINMVIDSVTATIPSTTHGTNHVGSTSIEKTGYTPIGVVGFTWDSGTRQNWFSLYRLYVDATTVNYSMLNMHSTDSASGVIRFYVLYLKD